MVILLQHSNNLSTGHSSVSDPATGALSRAGHTAAAVVLGLILVLGFVGNFLVLLVFSRFRCLQTPANLLLVNVSASDMLVCLFGTPLSFAASVRGRWLTGTYGCRWYGFSNALFGIVSLVSLSLLSLERYSVVLRSAQPDSSQYRRARLAIAASWFYSLLWTLPPLLGWGSYGPEGPGTVCSVQWHQRSAPARSYISCLFIFCLLLPLLLMVFCYGRILLALRAMARQLYHSKLPPVCEPCCLCAAQQPVLQVFPVHDQVQLRSPAHSGTPQTAQQQGGVASHSQPGNTGTEDSCCTAAQPGAGGSICNIEVKGSASSEGRSTPRDVAIFSLKESWDM
ncbi:pinopsin-like isoform X3 [Acanthopagrus latus]|uniref:pinopsin-like isoform X3 n=1 Tax=Acanthopagrus latus TaxID=8177 RepID=UPI00187BCBB0|nr:pinopsin-like isoform X3 [Acanthopagrus latus]